MTGPNHPRPPQRQFDLLLPYYGDVDLMQAAVRSVLAQDGDDWQLTVLDDGYPDASVATWFEALSDPRVTYIRNDRNLGANRNYVKALSLASAPYLVMMGADDLMLPDYLRNLRRSVRTHPDAAVIQPGVRIIDGDGTSVDPLTDKVKRWTRPRASAPLLLEAEPLAASLLRGNWTYFPSMCWRTEVVKGIGFRPGLNVVQDLALLLDVVMEGGPLLLDPRVTFAYRRHAASDSSLRAVSGARFREEKRYHRAVSRQLDMLGWHRAAREARRHPTSRLHAVSLMPRLVRQRQAASFRAALRHATT